MSSAEVAPFAELEPSGAHPRARARIRLSAESGAPRGFVAPAFKESTSEAVGAGSKLGEYKWPRETAHATRSQWQNHGTACAAGAGRLATEPQLEEPRRLKMPSGPWHFLLLSVCMPLACGQISFPEHMVAAKVHDTVNLTCRTDFQGPLSWRHSPSSDKPFLEESHFTVIQGKQLILREIDIPSAGIYSCWKKEQKLDQMELLLMEENENEAEEYLSCTALTYSCSFECSWSLKSYTAARLSYKRDGQNSTSWFYPHSRKQNIFEFTLNLSSSPFAEESAPLVLTGEAVSSSLYLQRVQKFYLRDIVQPEPPQSVQCKKLGNNLSVTVQPASSWAQPFSYFPLIHQIEFMYKDNGQIGQSTYSEIPQAINKLRVRSRDPLVPSPWSQWSPWKNVKKAKKRKQPQRRSSGDNDTIICKGGRKKKEHKARKHHKY